jgi:hypothetical protein
VQGGQIDAAAVTNLTLSNTRSERGVDLALSVRNLFDVEHGDPGAEEHRQMAIPQDGRTLSLRATWRF